MAVNVCCLAQAGGGFFSKPAKPKPAQERVPEMIILLKTNPDESLRADAAAELRQFDPTVFPEIIPALIDSLQGDKKPGVRAECASSLSKIKGVHARVGNALEYSMANDPSMRVRLQARSSLFTYQLSGYRSTGKPTGMIPTTEPPIASAMATSQDYFRPTLLPTGRPVAPPPTTADRPGAEKPARGLFPIINSWFRKPEAPPPGRRETPLPLTPVPERVDGPDLGIPR